jgi:hypothetical protein
MRSASFSGPEEPTMSKAKAYDHNDIQEMLLVKEHLLEERNFAMRQKNWPRVTVYRQKLKHCENRIASLRFANR